MSSNQCPPPPPPPAKSNPHPLSELCADKYSEWSWNGGFPFLFQVSLFLQFKRIIPAVLAVRRCSPLYLWVSPIGYPTREELAQG